MKPGVNDQSVFESVALHCDRAENFLDVFHLKIGNGKGNLDLQEVAKSSQARIQNDVSDLGNNLAGRAVQLGRVGPVGEESVQEQSRLVIQQENRISSNRPRKNLVHTCDFAVNHALKFLVNLLDGFNGYFGHFQRDAMTGEVGQGGGGAGVADINQFDQRVLLAGG